MRSGNHKTSKWFGLDQKPLKVVPDIFNYALMNIDNVQFPYAFKNGFNSDSGPSIIIVASEMYFTPGMQNKYKPVIWMRKSPAKIPKNFLINRVEVQAPAKIIHEWEQSSDDCRLYIQQLTKGNDLILDPMCGPGTYPMAAMELGRKVIGIEIEKKTFQIAQKRMQTRLAELTNSKAS